jgi:hypothetical protein
MLKRISELVAGHGLVEYSRILMPVAIIVTGAWAVLGPTIGEMFDQVVLALTRPPEVEPPPAPPECYGSLLLPIVMAITGLGLGVSYLLPPLVPSAAAAEI